MTVYVDTSVVLRVVLGEPRRLREWPRIRRAVASELIRLECFRTLDRLRLRLGLDPASVADRRAAVGTVLAGFDLLPIERSILDRAAEPLPLPVGSLDALHLASAALARGLFPDIAFATHDAELAAAAGVLGFRVMGVGKRR